ncbi:MAG: DUF4198 domain-containing protein [Candidatus Saccharibacteria bacterium]|nr:DUF4198 domain-containing protein [Rhodoferax sp.]
MLFFTISVPRLVRGAVGIALLAAPAAQAHEFWFTPLKNPQPLGSTVALRLEVGEFFEGDAAGFSIPKAAALRHTTTSTERDLRPNLSPDAPEAEVLLELTEPGTHLLSFDSTPLRIALSADRFHAYLHDEGLDFIKAQREKAGTADQPGRERYWRNTKTLIQAGLASAKSASSDMTYATPTSQRLEIKPLNNPLIMKPGSDLRIRIVFDGKPLAGALVKAWHKLKRASTDRSEGQLLTFRTRTTANGEAVLQLPYAGGWMVSVVHMVPTLGEPEVDWDSYWGNLSFSLPEAPRPPRRP